MEISILQLEFQQKPTPLARFRNGALVSLTSTPIISQNRLENEVLKLKELQHKNVLQYHGYCFIDVQFVIVSNYVEKSLIQIIEHEKPWGRSKIYECMHGMAAGLFYLESKGIIHKYLGSPAILFVDGVLKIGGLVERSVNKNYTELDRIRYMAPENCAAEPYCSSESIVYSFGSICYELFTWKRIYDNLDSFVVKLMIRNGDHPTVVEDNDIGTIINGCWEREIMFEQLVQISTGLEIFANPNEVTELDISEVVLDNDDDWSSEVGEPFESGRWNSRLHESNNLIDNDQIMDRSLSNINSKDNHNSKSFSEKIIRKLSASRTKNNLFNGLLPKTLFLTGLVLIITVTTILILISRHNDVILKRPTFQSNDFLNMKIASSSPIFYYNNSLYIGGDGLTSVDLRTETVQDLISNETKIYDALATSRNHIVAAAKNIGVIRYNLETGNSRILLNAVDYGNDIIAIAFNNLTSDLYLKDESGVIFKYKLEDNRLTGGEVIARTAGIGHGIGTMLLIDDGLFFNDDGTLYRVELKSNDISVPEYHNMLSIGDETLQKVSGLAVGRTGNLYVSDSLLNAVFVLNPTWKSYDGELKYEILGVYTHSDTLLVALDAPVDIAVDETEEWLYVSEHKSDRIVRVRLDLDLTGEYKPLPLRALTQYIEEH